MIETRGVGCRVARRAFPRPLERLFPRRSGGLSIMTQRKAVQRGARRHRAPHRDAGGPQVRQALAARRRLSTVRLAMTLPRRPVRGGEVHASALERLDAAVDDRARASEEGAAARGRPDERTAAVALAAANEQLAAREAWVKYIERGC
jgi:hypothetical protein